MPHVSFALIQDRMEDEKNWIGHGEVGGERGNTRMGGGNMRHCGQVHAGIRNAWEGGGVCVA